MGQCLRGVVARTPEGRPLDLPPEPERASQSGFWIRFIDGFNIGLGDSAKKGGSTVPRTKDSLGRETPSNKPYVGSPPSGADPFAGTWQMMVTAVEHSNPDVSAKVGGYTETGKMVIRGAGSQYSVSGLPSRWQSESVSASGGTLTIRDRQAEGGPVRPVYQDTKTRVGWQQARG